MLRRISITNYLLIEHLELDLCPGFTAITGETGSGKSILLGALGLVMGDRADSSVARDPEKRCVIEVEYATNAAAVSAWCTSNAVPDERPLLLRRQIDAGGRSRAFVNDTPVRLEQLRELAADLVHIHSQHHTLLLNDTNFQLGLVDHAAGNAELVERYAAAYATWRKATAATLALREEEERSRAEADYLRFQFEELEAARLVPDEQAGLEAALAKAENAEELLADLGTVGQGVTGEEGVLAPLVRMQRAMLHAAKLDPSLNELAQRLQSAVIELQDIGNEADQAAEALTVDPETAQRLRERFDLLIRLQQKHRVSDSAALIVLRDELGERSARIGSLSDRIAEAVAAEVSAAAHVEKQAQRLSDRRVKALAPLAEQVTAALQDLGMPHARFTMDHRSVPLGAHGSDQVRALFSANKERDPAPLDKVASGGELGRVMLALIDRAVESKGLGTVIFDEIDTGVSGATANRVGLRMAAMAKERQVLAITHLPQIAGKADHHLLVSKDHDAATVQSEIRMLAPEERVEALARMLSGDHTSNAALANARELLER